MTALRDEASLPRKILLFCGLQKNKSQSPRLESRLEFVVTHTKKVCVFLTKITIFFTIGFFVKNQTKIFIYKTWQNKLLSKQKCLAFVSFFPIELSKRLI